MVLSIFIGLLHKELFVLQPGKKKGAKSAKSRKSAGSSPNRASSSKKKGKKSGKSSARTVGSRMDSSLNIEPRDPDMMDPPAMRNLYYIAHGPVDALEIRGFNWEDGPVGSKKKGKKKK